MARPLKTKVKLKRVVGVRVDDDNIRRLERTRGGCRCADRRVGPQPDHPGQSRPAITPARTPGRRPEVTRGHCPRRQQCESDRPGREPGQVSGEDAHYSNNSSRLSARCIAWSRRHDDLVQHRRRIWRRRGRLPRRRKRPCRQKA